jgi:hypothetical protein
MKIIDKIWWKWYYMTRKESVYFKWHISDYDGRRLGNGKMFQGKELFLCKRLTMWVRWGEWLIRPENLLREFGCDVSKIHSWALIGKVEIQRDGDSVRFMEDSVDELHRLLTKHIGNIPILTACDAVEKGQWFKVSFLRIKRRFL